MQDYKYCPRCRTAAYQNQPFCASCGFSYMQQPKYAGHPHNQTEAHIGMIIAMWFFTLACILIFPADRSFAYAMDIPAVGIAIWLLRTRSQTNKINGGIKIGLELLGLVLVISGAGGNVGYEPPTSMPPNYTLPHYQTPSTGDAKTDNTNRQIDRALNL